ncbi:hypothetical protein San01_07600 [Streptomyces angustmyceticus]|uniref:Uncharacterized protein n=1 Tax=Streptomyces angustmyceticus TaxID=285578 RepID=A0A5J4L271_9ACTN|nr:hypothetical protein San01_07600 [Streptomyces angustmyceticus]
MEHGPIEWFGDSERARRARFPATTPVREPAPLGVAALPAVTDVGRRDRAT